MPQDVSFGIRFRKPTPVVGATLVVLVVMYVVTALDTKMGAGVLYEALRLDPRLVLRGQHLWGVLTYGLLHDLGDPDHLLFNGLVFYFFGPDLEELWGARRFIPFMVVACLGGAAFIVASAALGLGGASVVGFSSVVLGVLAAWALSWPDKEVFLLFFRVKGIYLLYIEIGLQLLTALSMSRVSAAGHFGGIAAGAAWAAATSGPLRRWWLQRKLARLQAEKEALHAGSRRRADGPKLRVIPGGADNKPKDKRFLN
jgi:membrane associated rhomboid family serine protease